MISLCRKHRKLFLVVSIVTLLLLLAGCSSIKEKAGEMAREKVSEVVDDVVDNVASGLDMDKESLEQLGSDLLTPASSPQGVPEYFTDDFPFYEGAIVVDYQEFNGNHFAVVTQVPASYEDVLDYYATYYALDLAYAGDDGAYYEGFVFGDIMVQGLTIEPVGDMTTVYVTLEDYTYDEEAMGQVDEEYNEGDSNAEGAITYENAQEVTLSDQYPHDLVPIFPGAKIIDSSFVEGTNYGFVELILPPDAFADAVEFYTEELAIEPRVMSNVAMESADFGGDVGDYKLTLMISDLLAEGNDPYAQIVLDIK